MKFKYIIQILVLVTISLWIAVFTLDDQKLHLVTCNVGQGDSNLIYYKNIQILIDGGKGDLVLDCLNKYIPFWDKTIEVVVITHPQFDHFGGIVSVAKSYTVNNYLVSGVDSSAQEWQVLKDLVGSSDTHVINVDSSQKYRLGLISLDILWPANNYLSKKTSSNISSISNSTRVLGVFTTNEDPNDFSVVIDLNYKNFNALYTGDIGKEFLENILTTNSLSKINLLKVPHHGSDTGLSENLVKLISPQIAVIGVGKNSYGHPSQKILKLLEDNNVKTYRTDLDKDIEIITDGNKWQVR